MTDSEMQTITEKTKLPISVVAGVVSTALIMSIWIQTTLSSMDDRMKTMAFTMETKLQSMIFDIKVLQDKLSVATSDRWTGSDMNLWAETLKIRNPTIAVPDPIHR